MPRRVKSVNASEDNIRAFEITSQRLEKFANILEHDALMKRMFRFEIRALKKLSDAINTENRILTLFEKASQVKAYKKKVDEKIGTIRTYVKLMDDFDGDQKITIFETLDVIEALSYDITKMASGNQ
jgi:uncharacterized protein YaaR (DUF327 family)